MNKPPPVPRFGYDDCASETHFVRFCLIMLAVVAGLFGAFAWIALHAV